jgi:hypothetical protein
MDEQFAQTMGNLIKRLGKFAGFDDDLKERILVAKKRRDFLTHSFWRDRSVEFATAEGRAKMRDELAVDAEMFGQVDHAIDAAAKTLREYLGIDDKIVDEYIKRQVTRLKAGLPWDEVPPGTRGHEITMHLSSALPKTDQPSRTRNEIHAPSEGVCAQMAHL